MKTAREYVEEMIRYKKSLGYSESTYRVLRNNFVPYVEAGNADGTITEGLLDSWCLRRKSENDNGYIRRMSAIRSFINYLDARGEYSYGFDEYAIPRSGRRYTPYIFSDAELLELFRAADRTSPIKRSPLRHEVIRTIYRLIYFCGLRPTEGRLLFREDVNTDEGTLLIRKNKARRERLIPMSEDVCEMCRDYQHILRQVYPESRYFFPSSDGKAYSAEWLQVNLKKLWKTAHPESRARVRVYDLRHKFATVSLMRLIDSGTDINSAFPYLSAYMGHSEYQHTLYYIHLLPRRLAESDKINLSCFESYIPEVPTIEEE